MNMPRFFFTLFLVISVVLTSVHAQQVVTTQSQPAAAPTPAPPPALPPDQKAYDEARRIKDPQKKIDALEKLIKDYPNGFVGSMARNDVFDTTIKNFPTETDKIRAAAEKLFEPYKNI